MSESRKMLFEDKNSEESKRQQEIARKEAKRIIDSENDYVLISMDLKKKNVESLCKFTSLMGMFSLSISCKELAEDIDKYLEKEVGLK